jgi:hypothetical protein
MEAGSPDIAAAIPIVSFGPGGSMLSPPAASGMGLPLANRANGRRDGGCRRPEGPPLTGEVPPLGGGPAVSGGLCRQRQTAEWNVLRGSRPVPVPLRPVCPHSPGPAPAEGCCGPHGYDRHMATTATSGCGRLPTRCCRCLPTGCWQLPGRGLSGRARESGYRTADGKPSADRRPVLCRA